jgi:tetratricopeptide (TPR) repeat protein
MSNETITPRKAAAPSQCWIQWLQEVITCLVCALIVGLFVLATDPNVPFESTGQGAQGFYYNLLVEGFSEGHLYVKRDAPAALARLANPYDAIANAPYTASCADLSYYKGRLYLYFGVTPALVLFWPYHALTGRYLPEGSADAILFALGFTAALGLIRSICRHYFPEINIWMLTAYMLVLGLTMGLTVSGSYFDIARMGGFAFAMLALVAIWRAINARPWKRAFWLALASLAYGLAIGSRPSLLFGAIVLLIPVIRTWEATGETRLRWQATLLFVAAVVPITLIGLGLMLYNDLRFNNPFEFGWQYQLVRDANQTAMHQFSLDYFWFSFRLYFSQFVEWRRHFPFLQPVPLPAPAGYWSKLGNVGGGILWRYPVVLLILAVPWAWRGRPAQAVSSLRWFAIGLFLVFVASSFVLYLFCTSEYSYEMDFMPVLLLLSVVGFLGLERVMLPFRRGVVLLRWSWCLLLLYSLIFNVLSNVERLADIDYLLGNNSFHSNRFDESLVEYQKAEDLWPDYADAHYGVANALFKKGRINDAIAEYQKALEIQPAFPEADNNLAYAFLQTGRPDEAITYFQKALEFQQTYQVYYNLGYVYRRNKMGADAVANYQKALQLQPQFVPAQRDLAWMLATWPEASVRNGNQAVVVAGEANRLTGSQDPHILRTLAAAYAEAGRFSEAVATAKRALTLASGESSPVLINELQTEIGLYQSNSPCRSTAGP